ncbi:MAG: MinD/ParA family ATP-binding protein [Acidimicrobiales bacterium]
MEADVGVLVFGSVRSCGVTTLATALAATWPTDRRVLLIELDPAGGTLAAASGWPSEPSLVSLAAAGRRASDPDLVWKHCQTLPGGNPVLAGPANPEQARSALGMLAGLLGRLGELDADVLVDCGRLEPRSPGMAVLDCADRMVLAARPCLADLNALAVWGETRSMDGKRPGLVTVGDGPYPDAEITDTLGTQVLGRVPWDPAAAEALVTLPVSDRELRMAPLVRSAQSLADHLAGDLAGTATVGDPLTGAPAKSSSSGVSLQSRTLRSRVLRQTWRPESTARSTNGSTPEEANR